MTSNYCDVCGHGKIYHRKHEFGCKLCGCEKFVRGVERDVFGNIVGEKKKKGCL